MSNRDCGNCQHYCGEIHNYHYFCCAIHPYGPEARSSELCADWVQCTDTDKFLTPKINPSNLDYLLLQHELEDVRFKYDQEVWLNKISRSFLLVFLVTHFWTVYAYLTKN